MDMQTYIDTHSQDTDTEIDAGMNTAIISLANALIFI